MPLSRIRRRLGDDPRLARMLYGGASSLLARGLSVVISLVTLPLTVRYLGRLEYGVWITISTSVVMINVLDLGIANTLNNFISRAYARDDRDQAARYFATAVWLNVAVAMGLGILAFILWRTLDWGNLLHLNDPALIASARLAVGIALIYFVAAMPLNLASRVLSGFQQVHIANYFYMVNSVLGLIAILVTVFLHGSLVYLMVAFCTAMLTGTLLLNLWLFHNKPWMRPYPNLIDRTAARGLLRQGSLFFILQLTSLVVFNSDNLVITHYLGAGEVTPYSIAWRLTSYASLLQTLMIPAFWPAFTEAYHKHDMAWVRTTYRMVVRKTFAVVSVAAILIGLCGQQFIRIWAGEAAIPPATLIWTMAGWAVLVSLTTNQTLLLTATGRLRLQTAVAVVASIVNLGLSIFLVQRIGSEGVILATIASYATFVIIPQAWEVRRVLSGAFLPAIATPDAVATPSPVANPSPDASPSAVETP